MVEPGDWEEMDDYMRKEEEERVFAEAMAADAAAFGHEMEVERELWANDGTGDASDADEVRAPTTTQSHTRCSVCY